MLFCKVFWHCVLEGTNNLAPRLQVMFLTLRNTFPAIGEVAGSGRRRLSAMLSMLILYRPFFIYWMHYFRTLSNVTFSKKVGLRWTNICSIVFQSPDRSKILRKSRLTPPSTSWSTYYLNNRNTIMNALRKKWIRINCVTANQEEDGNTWMEMNKFIDFKTL